MEEIKDSFNSKEESNFSYEMPKNDSPLLDMGDFETLESSLNASSGFAGDRNPEKDVFDEPFETLQSGLTSTTRPLVTSNEEELIETGKGVSSSLAGANLLDYVNVEQGSSLIGNSADTRVEDSFRDPVPEPQQRSDGDQLLIDHDEDSSHRADETERSVSATESKNFSPLSSSKVHESELVETLPKIKDPKIDTKPKAESDNYESSFPAYEPAAQPVKSEVAMEAEKVGNAAENKEECECPFSPGAWFNPDKLHPVVAKYVYWQDPKKSGIALGASLVLLLSFKYFSVISVIAYLTLALLCVTVSFRIYKNVLQAVQKSNEGHPFKEYLEMDIALSQEKVSQTVESLIHHVNCASGKLRSLILVEDLVDTIKLAILAWCMTYVGAWFNFLTLVILGDVAAFTLPKVYETNKTQIDAYTELVRTKGKEVIEMVNAKMPMGKKKKEQ
ncbi:Reticulon-4 [Araneus ventricosus]|uniref:Reticulon-like protein n=1 Tax=Araneus ventricosus TaxID=182803 RepID=A0A4Y2Q7H3_ARAVE|nr:Reticulon-4 [Araneus ventricosus]